MNMGHKMIMIPQKVDGLIVTHGKCWPICGFMGRLEDMTGETGVEAERRRAQAKEASLSFLGMWNLSCSHCMDIFMWKVIFNTMWVCLKIGYIPNKITI